MGVSVREQIDFEKSTATLLRQVRQGCSRGERNVYKYWAATKEKREREERTIDLLLRSAAALSPWTFGDLAVQFFWQKTSKRKGLFVGQPPTNHLDHDSVRSEGPFTCALGASVKTIHVKSMLFLHRVCAANIISPYGPFTYNVLFPWNFQTKINKQLP